MIETNLPVLESIEEAKHVQEYLDNEVDKRKFVAAAT